MTFFIDQSIFLSLKIVKPVIISHSNQTPKLFNLPLYDKEKQQILYSENLKYKNVPCSKLIVA